MEITPESQCVNRTASLSVFQETPLRLMSNQRVYNDEYNMDPHPEKMYLGSREYFAEDGEVWTLPVVRKVHRQILNDPTLCHDDISVLGQSEFNRVSTALILGSESIAIVEKRNAPEYSIIVLQVAAHWPTAMDPTPAEWRQIAEVMKRKRLFPFFFVTAQGLATGDLNKDAFPIRHFVTERFELLCAQSYSKNFGLCDERVGSLTIVSRDNPSLIRIRSQLMLTARCTWSTPPQLGARIVATILNNPAFFTEWQANLRSMAERLMLIREKLAEELRTLGTLRPLNHIRRQIGLYMFADFKDSEIMYLKKRRHIYLTSIGQINMSLMNSQNLSYVAQCISEAVQSGLETPETAQPTEL
ncbi:aspartate aminotransferase, cytoplasmic-like isoform X2 [Chiloscyllium plagiosum]|uniref:aspartate aminotransferase, cytoplasmic-like isoform X2 n=1 Tax=Chiloscyllium plagiosum TaxID=36176 RepID=UPI001CB7E591|nr:aspartate aminotransferase, cytoplasmic-like isoform X2 [Chiloscyllium plagiosum]